MDLNEAYDPAQQIAVVGMAGRFPGAPTTDALWSLLINRTDAIRPVPAERWDATAQLDPEREIQAVGGFLDGVDRFDAGFFGISPREAEDIDPQQRLLLETGWRALEDAGEPASRLAGSRTGVYVGASWHDYETLRRERGAPASQHSLVGNALDVIAARVSYFLGLRGPSLTVETGCSSSLVALHLAAQALRQGEIEGALVGGVNLILTPDVSIGLTHFGGLSPDGRCAAFSVDANGFVRGEGVAALYVKTLAAALRDGNRIHGVIARTVVNNDGGGDSLVTPSAEGQEELLRLAYGDNGISPDTLGYIEAHGTGTSRGDPVEAGAIGRVIGRRRSAPLPVGSVKTNIGHLEAAAGMAGLFKALLALRHGVVPPNLHADELNPEIPFDELNVSVVREPLPLPTDRPVFVGVNSFGWGGTNAHVVVGPAPQAEPEPEPTAPAAGLPHLVPLSAKNRRALSLAAGALAERVADEEPVAAVADTLARRRDHFPIRAAVAVDDAEGLRTSLKALASLAGEEGDLPDVELGRAVPRGRTAFVFPGQGSQWQGMGRHLYQESPLFAAVIDRCAEALAPHVEWDLKAIVRDEAGPEWMTRIDMLQPTLWAMSLGLAELWRAAGVTPDVVLGHSQGEITAATLAGILSYEDAAMIQARRSAVARRTSGRGLMLAVDLDRDAALAALEGFEETVTLAVHNGPRSCVLSGDREDVLTLKELLDAEGTFCRLVNVDYASHSPQMEELRPELVKVLAAAKPREGEIPLMSTVRVEPLAGTEMDAAYWAENLCRPVLFADAMRELFEDGVTHVVEISPHPILVPAIEQLVAEHSGPVAVVPTLRRDTGTRWDMGRALARAYVAGLEPFGTIPRHRPLDLPGYPLEPEPFWPAARTPRGNARRGFEVTLTPAPGRADTMQGPVELALTDLPWLADHRVHDAVTLPATAMLALAVQTGRARGGERPRTLDGVFFDRAVTFAGDAVRLTAEWCDDVPDGGSFRLLSLPDGGSAWTENARARVSRRGAPLGEIGFPDWAGSAEATDPAEFYRSCAARGLAYGTAFQGVRTLWTRPGEALGEVALADRLRPGNRPHVLHPALWDGALQVSLALFPSTETVVPVAADRVHLLDDLAEPVTGAWSHAVLRDDLLVDVTIFSPDRRPLVRLEGLRLRRIESDVDDHDDARLHRLHWQRPAEEAAMDAPRSGLRLVCGPGNAGRSIADAIAAAGVEVRLDAGDKQALDPSVDVADVVFVAPSAGDGLDAQRDALLRLTAVVRACVRRGTPPALYVVTAGAQAAVATDLPDPGGALFWGYLRVLRREHGELSPRLIDIDPADPEAAASAAAEILGGADDDQVALRGGARLVGRLVRGPGGEDATAELPPRRTGPQPFRVAALRPGLWEGVESIPLTRRPPGPGEVEVEVSAAALNFIDVLKAIGNYPDDSADASLLGGECAGRVTAVGPGVTEPRPGDRVVACAFGSLASHVTVRADHTRPIPGELSDADAAGLPLVLATAWYALADLARLEPGETVLVHSATGGVGLAAIGVVQALGGRVIATAGSAEKREYLRRAGIADVFDSRDLSWADGVRAATGGRGVDVVLNSLAGAAIPLGMDVLAEDGRFIEIGKKDIYAGRPVGLDAFRKGISFSAVDLAGMMDRRPERFARLLAAAWRLVAEGKLAPLPVRRYPFAEVTEALREMSHGRHIGKFVVVDPTTTERVAPLPCPDGRFRTDGTYVISGGLGALGLSLAEFLSSRGAGALLLLGRSAPDAEATARIAALRAAGTYVEVAGCDVSDATSVRRAVGAARATLPPIRGVVHAAGLLDDATISTLTAEQVARVLAPKVDGVRNLDAVTADDPLDMFVLFSSAAALVGNAGQAAYAAANAYLDAFAEARRRAGLPALSVQWGPFVGIGLAAADEQRGSRLSERGMGGFPVEEAWPALVRMLGRDVPVTGYVPIDLRRWFDAYPDTAGLASWRLLHAASATGEPSAVTASDFLDQLRRAQPGQRIEQAQQRVRELAGRVLRLDLDRVDPDTPFKELGLDSLMGLELRNRLEAAFGMKLSPTLLWTYGNARALAGALCERLPTGEAPAVARD